MVDPSKIVSLDRARAGREALRGAFPVGRTRTRLMLILEFGEHEVSFDVGQLAEEFATDQPIQHLLKALGGGWSARPDKSQPGAWIFQRHISAQKAWARIMGQPAE